MILKGPTGLWRNLIPLKPGDSGSITFTISNQEPPPPSSKLIPKLPDSVMARPLPVLQNRVLDDSDRRNLFGERIRSVVAGGMVYLRNGKKLFESGETVEFQEDTTSVEIKTVPGEISIRHNTNLLDLEGAGLTADEVAEVVRDAELMRDGLRNDIAAKQGEIEALRSEISSIQRSMNETNKAMKSLIVIYGLSEYPSGNAKFDRLFQSMEALTARRDEVVTSVNKCNSDIQIMRDNLVRLSEVIR